MQKSSPCRSKAIIRATLKNHRIDLRLRTDRKICVLGVNPNRDLAPGEEVDEAAEKGGWSMDP
jgi:hypothetical protein